MHNRLEHEQQVHAFLKKHLSIYDWRLSLPPGTGRETYLAHGFKRTYFVKVGVQVERYLAMADIGLTPPVIVHGHLDDGLPTIVQLYIKGRTPSRSDYRDHLVEVAELVSSMHSHSQIKGILPPISSNLCKDAGLQALERLRQKWEIRKLQVPQVAEFVDHSLDLLQQQVNTFTREGLVASHGDICNANWLFASDGKIYILDFGSMRMDDPALDLGALLWWYYPPELCKHFLEIAGYPSDDELKLRMQVRMALHCLDITLPRDGSFDQFNPARYQESLEDFKAVLESRENPQGYE